MVPNRLRHRWIHRDHAVGVSDPEIIAMHTDREWAQACCEAADWISEQHDPEAAAANADRFQAWLDRSALNRHAYLDVVEAEKQIMELCRRVKMAMERVPG